MKRIAFALLALGTLLPGCLDPGEGGNLVPRTVDEDPALPRIEVADTLLHAEAFGDPEAPLVITLHGGPGCDYRSILPLRALADDGYRVVFWDQRGAGLSQRHAAGTYSLDQYLEDLRLVIEHFTRSPDQPFVFIGHSWGAMYATWFINEYGDYGGRLRGAILSDPGAFTKPQLEAFMKRLVGSVDFIGEQLGDALWARQFMSPEEHASSDYITALFAFRSAPAEHNAGPKPFWRYGAVAAAKLPSLVEDANFDWTTHLDEFDNPVLFLRSELNTAATLAHQRELAASYPDAQVVTIEDVGHEMIWERPEEYLQHTRAYFDDIGFGGSDHD
jgi:proline iminopeptidase